MSQTTRRLHIALMTAATVALAFSVLIYLLYAVNLIAFPYDYDQGEGFEVQDTLLFSRGELPYRDTEAYPFYASNYPPLFHIMAAPFVWFFGPAYWYGRLLSFLGSLVGAGAIAYAVRRDGRGQRWIALLAGLAFLSSNFVYHIGPLFRQHTMMVTFEILAIVTLASAYPRRDRRGIVLGLILLVSAGYTKQLAAITALAAFAWMFLRGPRRAMSWLIVFALAGCLIFAGLNFASGGQWWLQAIVANVNEFIPEQALGLFLLWFKLHGALLLPAALLLLHELYFDRLSLYSVWLLASVLLGGIASGTWGAGDSYFVTSIAAICILSGQFFSRSLAGGWRSPAILASIPVSAYVRLGMIVIPLLYLGYARATLKMPVDGGFAPLAAALDVAGNVRGSFYDSATFQVGGYARIGYHVTADDVAAGDSIVALIEDTAGPILSEEAGFTMAAGRALIGNPTQLRNLHLAGLFAGEQLIQMIEAQEFALVILRAQFYPPPVLAAIHRRYALRHTIHMNGFDYNILYPKDVNEN